MTPETLSELKSLLEKSTPGELKSIALFGYEDDDDDKNTDVVLTLVIDKGSDDLIAIKMTDRDEKLYIALRNAAPDLIKAVEQRDRYMAALEEIDKYKPHRFSQEDYSYRHLQGLANDALKDAKDSPLTSSGGVAPAPKDKGGN